MLEFITSLPFRCVYKGQTAAIKDQALPGTNKYQLYLGTDNRKPIYKWVKAEECELLAVGINEPYNTRLINRTTRPKPTNPYAEDGPSTPQAPRSYRNGARPVQAPQRATGGRDGLSEPYGPVYGP